MKTLQKARTDYAEEYRQKLCSPEAAAATVKSGDSLCFPIFAGEPTLFVRALARRKHELEGVVVNQQHHLCPDYFTEDSVPHIKVNAWFTSHVSRQAVQKGWADFVPNSFFEVPRLLREYWPIDVAGTVVSPLTGAAINNVPIASALLGNNSASQQAGNMYAELAFVPHFPDVTPLTMRRGNMLSGSSVDVKIVGTVPTGINTGTIPSKTMREAVKVNAKELRVIDSVRFENYQRTDVKPDYGYGIYGEKTLRKRLTLGGGFVDIDPNYGSLNGDRYVLGKRLYLSGSFLVCPEISVASGFCTSAPALVEMAQRDGGEYGQHGDHIRGRRLRSTAESSESATSFDGARPSASWRSWTRSRSPTRKRNASATASRSSGSIRPARSAARSRSSVFRAGEAISSA